MKQTLALISISLLLITPLKIYSNPQKKLRTVLYGILPWKTYHAASKKMAVLYTDCTMKHHKKTNHKLLVSEYYGDTIFTANDEEEINKDLCTRNGSKLLRGYAGIDMSTRENDFVRTKQRLMRLSKMSPFL